MADEEQSEKSLNRNLSCRFPARNELKRHSMIEVTSNINCMPDDVLAAWLEALKRGSPEAPLTASPEWFRLMAAGQESASSVFVLRQDSGARVGVLPVIKQAWSLEYRLAGVRWFSRSFSSLRVVGGDLLENGVTASELAALWRTLFRDHHDVDVVWMDHVMVGRRSDLVLGSTHRHPACFASVFLANQPHHYARLSGQGDEVARSPSTRRRLVRYERALAADHGEVKIIEIRTESELMSRASEIETLMNHAWQAEWLGQTADLKSQVSVARAGLLRSWLLEAGGKPVAFLLGYQGTGVVCLHQIGYAQSMAKFSPGTLLLTHVMDKLAGEGPLVVDFGSGEAGYKEHFTNETGWSSRIMVVRRTARLRVILGLYHVTVALDRGIRRLLKTMRIKDWIVRKLKRGSGG
jgi:CelD/BcsL family acetyltransferase involved in cellulose biosynthesis